MQAISKNFWSISPYSKYLSFFKITSKLFCKAKANPKPYKIPFEEPIKLNLKYTYNIDEKGKAIWNTLHEDDRQNANINLEMINLEESILAILRNLKKCAINDRKVSNAKDIVQFFVESIEKLYGKNIVGLIWSFAKLDIYDQNLYNMFESKIQHNLNELDISELSIISWSLAKINHNNAKIWSDLCDQIMKIDLKNLSNNQHHIVVNFLWSLSKINISDKSILSHIEKYITTKLIKNISEANLFAIIIYSFSLLHKNNLSKENDKSSLISEGFWKKLETKLIDDIYAFDGKLIVLCMYSLYQANRLTTSKLANMEKFLLAKLETIEDKDINIIIKCIKNFKKISNELRMNLYNRVKYILEKPSNEVSLFGLICIVDSSDIFHALMTSNEWNLIENHLHNKANELDEKNILIFIYKFAQNEQFNSKKLWDLFYKKIMNHIKYMDINTLANLASAFCFRDYDSNMFAGNAILKACSSNLDKFSDSGLLTILQAFTAYKFKKNEFALEIVKLIHKRKIQFNSDELSILLLCIGKSFKKNTHIAVDSIVDEVTKKVLSREITAGENLAYLWYVYRMFKFRNIQLIQFIEEELIKKKSELSIECWLYLGIANHQAIRPFSGKFWAEASTEIVALLPDMSKSTFLRFLRIYSKNQIPKLVDYHYALTEKILEYIDNFSSSELEAVITTIGSIQLRENDIWLRLEENLKPKLDMLTSKELIAIIHAFVKLDKGSVKLWDQFLKASNKIIVDEILNRNQLLSLMFAFSKIKKGDDVFWDNIENQFNKTLDQYNMNHILFVAVYFGRIKKGSRKLWALILNYYMENHLTLNSMQCFELIQAAMSTNQLDLERQRILIDMYIKKLNLNDKKLLETLRNILRNQWVLENLEDKHITYLQKMIISIANMEQFPFKNEILETFTQINSKYKRRYENLQGIFN